MERVLVHGNNAGFGVYLFLSLPTRLPTYPIIWLWEGCTVGKVSTLISLFRSFPGCGSAELPPRADSRVLSHYGGVLVFTCRTS